MYNMSHSSFETELENKRIYPKRKIEMEMKKKTKIAQVLTANS